MQHQPLPVEAEVYNRRNAPIVGADGQGTAVSVFALLMSCPGIVPRSGGISTPASHSEEHPLLGRDLSGLLTAQASEAEVAWSTS
jgi:hypothetical protein